MRFVVPLRTRFISCNDAGYLWPVFPLTYSAKCSSLDYAQINNRTSTAIAITAEAKLIQPGTINAPGIYLTCGRTSLGGGFYPEREPKSDLTINFGIVVTPQLVLLGRYYS